MATEQREELTVDELHKALDTIMSCPYDDLKTSLSLTLDIFILLSSERGAEALDEKNSPGPYNLMKP
jgi:hypothetical protein